MRKILITCLFFLPLISMAAASYKISWVNDITPGAYITNFKISDQCIKSIEPADFTDLEYQQLSNMTLIDNNNIGDGCTNKEKYENWAIWNTATGKPILVGDAKFRHWSTGLGVFGSWRTSIDVDIRGDVNMQATALCFDDSADGGVYNCINSADGIKDVKAVCIILTQRGHKPSMATGLRCSAEAAIAGG